MTEVDNFYQFQPSWKISSANNQIGCKHRPRAQYSAVFSSVRFSIAAVSLPHSASIMRLSMLMLVAIARRFCFGETVCDGYISEGVGFLPYVGNFRDLGCGIANGDAWDTAMGAGGLALDVVTLGLSSAAKTAAKATSKVAKVVRVGKKGQSLVKASKTTKAWKTGLSWAEWTEKWVDRVDNSEGAGQIALRAYRDFRHMFR